MYAEPRIYPPQQRRRKTLRRSHSTLAAAATTVRAPCGRREGASRFPCGHLTDFNLMTCTIAVTFVNTATAARKAVRFVKIASTNRRPQNRTAAASYVTKALRKTQLYLSVGQSTARGCTTTTKHQHSAGRPDQYKRVRRPAGTARRGRSSCTQS